MGKVSKASGAGKKLALDLEALLYQNLETELGGVEVYTNAIRIAVNEELKEEWTKYLAQTKRHVEIAQSLLNAAGLDPEAEVPARVPVRTIGQALVKAMLAAESGDDPNAAQITAAECVVLAETKDHSNWELLGLAARNLKGEFADELQSAVDEVEDEEDEHLYHTAGWARELAIESLGMKASLPPPEEEKDVKNAITAARVKKSRERELS